MAGQLSSDPLRNEETLSAMGICSNIEEIPYMVLISFFISISTRVSNELGAGEAIRAKRAAACSIIVCTIVGVILTLCLVLPRKLIGSMFAKDEEIVGLVQSLMWPTALYMFGSSVIVSFEGIVLGCGRQTAGAIFVVVAYFIIGLPVSYVLGFKWGLGVMGLTLGRLAGKIAQLFMMGILYVRINWQGEVDRASSLLTLVNANESQDQQGCDENESIHTKPIIDIELNTNNDD